MRVALRISIFLFMVAICGVGSAFITGSLLTWLIGLHWITLLVTLFCSIFSVGYLVVLEDRYDWIFG